MMLKKSSILERVKRWKALTWNEGELTLFKMKIFLGAAALDLYKNRLIELNNSKKRARSILYQLGCFQGKEAFKIISRLYGFSKRITDKSKMLDLQISQTELTGHGTFKFTRKDFKNKIFVVHGNSTYARIYKEKIGLSKEVEDNQMRGVFTKFVESIIKEPCFGIETKCIAKGDSYCEFVIKTIDKWDKDDPIVKKQTPIKLKADDFKIHN
ncbi:4-vinyl reductase [Candidatus Woesearchaeota archaeon]|nr:4-vinyl reductase [Candidatus Woesearchaeota archaeon]